jgi:hypothetical protein
MTSGTRAEVERKLAARRNPLDLLDPPASPES